jgi:hypothetical protein
MREPITGTTLKTPGRLLIAGRDSSNLDATFALMRGSRWPSPGYSRDEIITYWTEQIHSATELARGRESITPTSANVWL